MKNSYDDRVIRYETVTNFSDEMFDELVRLINPRDGQAILDCGAGYAPVTQAIISRHPSIDVDYCILEYSEIQIQRAKKEVTQLLQLLGETKHVAYQQNSAADMNYDDNSFDTVITKMVLHELPAAEQVKMINEIYRILKPGGKFILWQTILDDSTVEFYRNMFRKKDSLAGYESLVENRNFITQDAFYFLLDSARFHEYELARSFTYNFNSKYRLYSELQGDWTKLRLLNEYLVNLVTDEGDDFSEKTNFTFEDDNVSLFFKQGVYLAKKPLTNE
ncbi:MAG: class I SAM-dependent methyltransferase [Dyadobacter sp.]|uniref:class I SAM-dependent methyltransferase n=1 Tax=Dyadobacter sp. TaxID=1914288 RepID=UPI003263D600